MRHPSLVEQLHVDSEPLAPLERFLAVCAFAMFVGAIALALTWAMYGNDKQAEVERFENCVDVPYPVGTTAPCFVVRQ